MGNDDDGHTALCRNTPQHSEEFLRFLGRQHRRRLVQNQNIRTAVQRLQDLGPLLQTHTDLLHHSRRLHLQAVFLCQIPHRLVGRVLIKENARLPGFPAHNDLLGDRKAGNQHKMLMHHAHAFAHRHPGAEPGDFFPFDRHLPRRGR